MTRRADRFRGLPRGQTGDLFEHFGVPVSPTAAEESSASGDAEEIVQARPCRQCGWFLDVQAERSCPICGAQPRGPT
jgi:hypothetical protein